METIVLANDWRGRVISKMRRSEDLLELSLIVDVTVPFRDEIMFSSREENRRNSIQGGLIISSSISTVHNSEQNGIYTDKANRTTNHLTSAATLRAEVWEWVIRKIEFQCVYIFCGITFRDRQTPNKSPMRVQFILFQLSPHSSSFPSATTDPLHHTHLSTDRSTGHWRIVPSAFARSSIIGA